MFHKQKPNDRSDGNQQHCSKTGEDNATQGNENQEESTVDENRSGRNRNSMHGDEPEHMAPQPRISEEEKEASAKHGFASELPLQELLGHLTQEELEDLAEVHNAIDALRILFDREDDHRETVHEFAVALAKLDAAVSAGSVSDPSTWNYQEKTYFASEVLSHFGYDSGRYELLRLFGYEPLSEYADLRDEENTASSRGTRRSIDYANSSERLRYANQIASNAANGLIVATSSIDNGDGLVIVPPETLTADSVGKVVEGMRNVVASGEPRVGRDDEERLDRTDPACMMSRLVDLIDDVCGIDGSLVYAYAADAKIDEAFGPFAAPEGEQASDEYHIKVGVLISHNGSLLPVPQVTASRLMSRVAMVLAAGGDENLSRADLDEAGAAVWQPWKDGDASTMFASGNGAYTIVDGIVSCLLDAMAFVLSLVNGSADMSFDETDLCMEYETEPRHLESIGAPAWVAADPDALPVSEISSTLEKHNNSVDTMLDTIEKISVLRAVCARSEDDDKRFKRVMDEASSLTDETLLFSEWSDDAAAKARETYMPAVNEWARDHDFATRMLIYAEQIDSMTCDMSNAIERLLDACSALAANPIRIYAVYPIETQDDASNDYMDNTEREAMETLGLSISDAIGISFQRMKYNSIQISTPAEQRPLLPARTRRILRGLAVATLQHDGGVMVVQAVLGDNASAVGSVRNAGGEPVSDARQDLNMMKQFGMPVEVADGDAVTFFTVDM